MTSRDGEIHYVNIARTSGEKKMPAGGKVSGGTGRNSRKKGTEPGGGKRKTGHGGRKRSGHMVWIWAAAVLFVVCILKLADLFLFPAGKDKGAGFPGQGGKNMETSSGKTDSEAAGEEDYQEILELLGRDVVSGSSREELTALEKLFENNEEARDFVLGYPKREEMRMGSIDLSEDFTSGTVPLLMQWDPRWGYDLYGDSMIGLAGCGPTCMTMVYLYFTEDISVNPRTMAQFAYKNGYYVNGGTSWDLWTEGAEKLGLKGEELPLDQARMEKALDGGRLIVCSMRPGDFTTTGHFILLYDYDEKGFYVHDPNRRSNSEKQWTYETLSGQIKNLWALGEQ